MKVTMGTTMAGPDGVVLAGKVVDLKRAEAQRLIKAGYAEAYVETKKTKPVEMTTAPAAEETTSDPDESEVAEDKKDSEDKKDAEDEKPEKSDKEPEKKSTVGKIADVLTGKGKDKK